MSDREMILRELRPLYKEAREKGLWFFCSYQGLWFSPDELEARQKDGSFIWGAVNWRLRNPEERLSEIENGIKAMQEEAKNFKERIAKSR